MSASPYFLTGPALISFSGGRTSAYMLRRILDAHEGSLPDDVHVCFANTGKEREETLRFVHECESRWGVRVHWLEWRTRAVSVPIADRFEEVGYNSASRNGEPFAALIAAKSYTPNAVTRYCTSELKVRVMKYFMQNRGYKNWSNVVGLRHDERHRVAKSRKPNKEAWDNILPLDDAKVSNRDVRAFWYAQDFDLELLPFEGNCDGCFLKARPKLWEIERTKPGTLAWWAQMEVVGKAALSPSTVILNCSGTCRTSQTCLPACSMMILRWTPNAVCGAQAEPLRLIATRSSDQPSRGARSSDQPSRGARAGDTRQADSRSGSSPATGGEAAFAAPVDQ